jgi:hypothetical protein
MPISEIHPDASPVDKQPRKTHFLLTLYYILFFVLFGFGLALVIGLNGNVILAFIIAVLTVSIITVFVTRQARRR